MRLIDADAVLSHQIEANRMGAMLVVRIGHILNAPTIDARTQPDPKTGFMPCVYCNDTDEQANLFEENNYTPYTGMESTISINRQQDGKYFICADLWGGSNCVADFEIHFCPMCGRGLM